MRASVRMTRKRWIELARKYFDEPGTIEIDSNAKVRRARGMQGAYVAAWVWVDHPTKPSLAPMWDE